MLLDFLTEKASGDECVLAFFKSKAIERQYHTYFDWKERKANSFFRLFGAGFRDFMIAEVKSDELLNKAIQSFLELGDVRNSLVHQDYANFYLEKTVDEIYGLYKLGLGFVEALPQKLKLYSGKISGASS